MKTLPEILEKFSNTIALGIMGNVPGAEGTPIYHEPEGAINDIAKELMGCLPEKMTEEKGYHGYAERFAHNKALDEVRARLTAFIGHKG